jgi:kumamolisin
MEGVFMPRRRHVAAAALALLILTASLPAAASPRIRPAAPVACGGLVRNGSFETQGANWTQSGAGSAQLITDLNPRTGDYSADLGDVTNTDHSIRQQITLPSRPHLSLTFWWEQWTQESAPGNLADYLSVNLLRTDGSLLKELVSLGADPDRPPWDQLSFSLSAYAGQTLQLQFLAHNDSTNPTEFFVDDVSISACNTYLPLIRR